MQEQGDPENVACPAPPAQPRIASGTHLQTVATLDLLIPALARQGLWSFWVCVLFRLLWSHAEYGPGIYALAASVLALAATWTPLFLRRVTEWMRGASADAA